MVSQPPSALLIGLTLRSRPDHTRGSVGKADEHSQKLAGQLELSGGLPQAVKAALSAERGRSHQETVNQEVRMVETAFANLSDDQNPPFYAIMLAHKTFSKSEFWIRALPSADALNPNMHRHCKVYLPSDLFFSPFADVSARDATTRRQ
jgi:hypothetical protein